jgi:oxygen-independent coproporphyrinogen-3 oxidase
VAYVDALCEDLVSDLPLAGDRVVSSVFFGGGTPSLFEPSSIARFLGRLTDYCDVARDAEITLEANPGTIERGRFAGYAQAGVNRVSLGAQTFRGSALEALGRIHGPDDIAAAVTDLRSAGIDNFNLDLMYGLPGQDLDAAVEDVRRALELHPTHLSHYQLTLEPGTPFFRRPPELPDDDATLEMQLACQAAIGDAGFDHYEVSAYASPGRSCRHNLAYWTFGDYLGLGAGAHGKLTTDEGILRTERLRRPREYLARGGGSPATRRQRVEPAELPFEYALNALRLTGGFELGHFESATGLPRSVLSRPLGSLVARGLLDLEGERVRASALGLRFLNDVQQAFLPEPASGPGRAA